MFALYCNGWIMLTSALALTTLRHINRFRLMSIEYISKYHISTSWLLSIKYIFLFSLSCFFLLDWILMQDYIPICFDFYLGYRQNSNQAANRITFFYCLTSLMWCRYTRLHTKMLIYLNIAVPQITSSEAKRVVAS